MVTIGLIGTQDCGKTSLYLLFEKFGEKFGCKFVGWKYTDSKKEFIPNKSSVTVTLDFLRFSWKGNIHTLYGTGGHLNRITDYYRLFVLRNAERFLCMIDLSEGVESQLDFFKAIHIPSETIVLAFNKYDIGGDNLKTFDEVITRYFNELQQKTIQNKFTTVSIEKNGFETYNENAIRAVLSLCD